MKTKTIGIRVLCMLALLIISSVANIVSANENRSGDFINVNVDSTRGFYEVLPFYVNFDTHTKVPVNMVTVTPLSIVVNKKVIIEYVNTDNVPLTIEIKDVNTGVVVYSDKISVGYESSYTLDSTGIYDVMVVEHPGLRHQSIVASVVSVSDSDRRELNPPEIKNDWSKLPESPSNTVMGNTNPNVTTTPYVVSPAVPDNISHTGAIITPTPTSDVTLSPSYVTSNQVVVTPSPVVVEPAITYNPQQNQPCGKAICVSGNSDEILKTTGEIFYGIAVIGNSIWNAFSVQ